MRSTGFRWALVALPLLAGAVLLMHGLDSRASERSTAALAQGLSHEHPGEAEGSHDDGHCADCHLGHLMAACVAVFAAVVTFAGGRRLRVHIAATKPVAAASTWRDRAWGLRLHPPEPAWVRLAVMQR